MASGLRALGPYNSLPEAQLVRTRLAASGIDAHVTGENASSILGDQLAFGQGFRVLIADAVLDAALEILEAEIPHEEEVAPEPTDARSVSAREPVRCPVCSGALLAARPGARWIRAIARLRGRALPAGWRCSTCDHRF